MNLLQRSVMDQICSVKCVQNFALFLTTQIHISFQLNQPETFHRIQDYGKILQQRYGQLEPLFSCL
jgi:hypothetical protein